MTTRAGLFNSVLVAFDGSEPACAALTQALALLQPSARLTIVTVVNDALEALDEEGRAILADAVSQCVAANVTSVTELVHGLPVPAILETAKRFGCDLIVMGTHAQTGVARLFLGSTTEGVLRWSDVPVLVLREPVPEAAAA